MKCNEGRDVMKLECGVHPKLTIRNFEIRHASLGGSKTTQEIDMVSERPDYKNKSCEQLI